MKALRDEIPLTQGSEAARECYKTIEYRFPSSVTEPQRDRGGGFNFI